jgi:uncharacterized protein YndB with AHSA1/START domain
VTGTVDHATVVVERTVNAPLSLVYRAIADIGERTKWGAPSETAVVIYDEADFRVGGRDLFRCGAKADPRYRVETRYVDIVAERLVVQTEVIHEGDKLLAANVTTLELMPDGACTRVKVTAQVASFVGPAMIESTKAGHEGSLASMARHVERARG